MRYFFCLVSINNSETIHVRRDPELVSGSLDLLPFQLIGKRGELI